VKSEPLIVENGEFASMQQSTEECVISALEKQDLQEAGEKILPLASDFVSASLEENVLSEDGSRKILDAIANKTATLKITPRLLPTK
jgi:hypothetical protein